MSDGQQQSAIAVAATPWAERGVPRLAKEHEAYLRARVPRKAYWREAGFRSDADGLIIPYFYPDGRQMDGYARKRLLPVRVDADGKEQKFDQPPGTKNRLYFAPGLDWVGKPPRHVFLGEGELRAAAFGAYGRYALGIGGVWNFLTKDAEDEPSKLIPDFNLLQLKGLEVTLVYDADVVKKYKLQRALLRQAAILEGRGAKVDVLIVPDMGDGKTGIDDFIASKGVEAALALPRKKLTDDYFLFWGAPSEPNPTDLGNAERFADMHARQVRYVPQWKSWLVWDDQRWLRDHADQARHRAIITARGIYKEASTTVDPARRELLGKWALQSESAPRLKAMLDVASSLPEFSTSVSELDAKPWHFVCANGTVDLEAMRLDPGSPEYLLTHASQVKFDPGARAPAWERFVEETFCGDADLVSYVRRVAGYMLSGDISEQCFFVFFGAGANGKSTFISILQALLGEYAAKSRMETWVSQFRAAGSSTEDLARLAGKRFVVAEESEDEQRLAVSLVKEVTGGDKITARNMYERSFEYLPQFKLVLVCNHKPVVPGDDPALWRRLRLVPFDHVVPPERRDRRLKQKLARELPGVLNWALRGYQEWRAAGELGEPRAIREATDKYKSDFDLIGQFIDEKCVLEDLPQHRREKEARTCVETSELYKAYHEWATERGYRAPRTMNWFARRMHERGFKREPGSRYSRLLGITAWGRPVGNFDREGKALSVPKPREGDARVTEQGTVTPITKAKRSKF